MLWSNSEDQMLIWSDLYVTQYLWYWYTAQDLILQSTGSDVGLGYKNAKDLIKSSKHIAMIWQSRPSHSFNPHQVMSFSSPSQSTTTIYSLQSHFSTHSSLQIQRCNNTRLLNDILGDGTKGLLTSLHTITTCLDFYKFEVLLANKLLLHHPVMLINQQRNGHCPQKEKVQWHHILNEIHIMSWHTTEHS